MVEKSNKGGIRLGVNVDHVATVRNARGTDYPSPVIAAKMAEVAGADGITAHLREDRRHINDRDILELKSALTTPLNLEMAATAEMSKKALEISPNAVCLVPERREEVTTEGGLDVVSSLDYLKEYVKPLVKSDIRVSLFVEADEAQISASKAVGAEIVEFHVGKYCDLLEQNEMTLANIEFQRYETMSKLAVEMGLEVHFGHGITYRSAECLSKIVQVKEMNIGHFLIGEAIYHGLDEAIAKMKRVINE